ncbi:WYL domain-containing protein, partial [Synechocystis salina LEGE 06155]|nr:WYL domain-containing protein [Synechocystis salina LEGE 06155]
MGRKGQSITLSLSEREKQQLEALALELGCLWGDRPNISKLIKDIAQNKLRIAPNHDWSTERIRALNQARLTLIDQGRIEDATAIAQLLLERSDITIPLRSELEIFLSTPIKPWRQTLERYILQQRPFLLTYQNPNGELQQFSISYAEIRRREKREYLDCWCAETEDNRDLPELHHNWCLRLDRISDAAVSPYPQPWRAALDTIEVELHLYGNLAFNYQSQGRPDRHNDWHPELPQTRQVIREISSTFWFLREILPYGKDCQVISPEGVRQRVMAELASA